MSSLAWALDPIWNPDAKRATRAIPPKETSLPIRNLPKCATVAVVKGKVGRPMTVGLRLMSKEQLLAYKCVSQRKQREKRRHKWNS